MQNLLKMVSEAANNLDVDLIQVQLDQFAAYISIIEKWQKKQNLVKYSSLEDLVLYHFIDSLQALRVCPRKNSSKILDLGTGAGFPGVPLKISLPNITITLNETQGKRCLFLQQVIKELALKDCQLLQGRAEFFAHQPDCRQSFDCVLTRAVAPLNVVLELSLPFLKIGGIIVAFRGLNAASEIVSAERVIKLLGGELGNVLPYQLEDKTGNKKNYHLIVVKKVLSTPEKYPRKAGIPQKRPL